MDQSVKQNGKFESLPVVGKIVSPKKIQSSLNLVNKTSLEMGSLQM